MVFLLLSVTFSPGLLFSCIASLHSSSNHPFLEVLEHIHISICLSFLALFPLQFSSHLVLLFPLQFPGHPVLFHLNLVNYFLSFPFKATIKFCFNICIVQITNITYTSVCFPAHKKLNLIVYTITDVPTLDTLYSFLCLYYNQIMV